MRKVALISASLISTPRLGIIRKKTENFRYRNCRPRHPRKDVVGKDLAFGPAHKKSKP